MMKQCVNFGFVDYFNKGLIDISNSKYLISSNNTQIKLYDFFTQKCLNQRKARSCVPVGFTRDEKICVFTSNGEECINVYLIPDLEELARKKTNYIFAIKVIENDTVMYLEKGRKPKEYYVNTWNFKTDRVLTIAVLSDDMQICNSFFEKNLLYVAFYGSFSKTGKYIVVDQNGKCIAYEISGQYNYGAISQLFLNNFLVSKKEKDFWVVGVYNFNSSMFTPIAHISNVITSLRWLTNNLFWFSSLKNSGIMTTNGEIIYEIPECAVIGNCSNKEYFISNSFGNSYLFKSMNTGETNQGTVL